MSLHRHRLATWSFFIRWVLRRCCSWLIAVVFLYYKIVQSATCHWSHTYLFHLVCQWSILYLCFKVLVSCFRLLDLLVVVLLNLLLYIFLRWSLWWRIIYLSDTRTEIIKGELFKFISLLSNTFGSSWHSCRFHRFSFQIP